MPHLPKVDNRLIQVFLSIIRVRDIAPHTRHCPLGADHRPKVDAGQDINNPQCLFMIYEEVRCDVRRLTSLIYTEFFRPQCRGVDGVRCDSHGLPYGKQLTEKQRVAALAQVVQLEPFPYKFEALLDWCVNYVTQRQHHLAGSENSEPAAQVCLRRSSAPPPPARPSSRAVTAATSHAMRHRRWVSSLIPTQSLSAGCSTSRGLSRVVPSARPSSSVSFNVPVTTLAKVYCYVRVRGLSRSYCHLS